MVGSCGGGILEGAEPGAGGLGRIGFRGACTWVVVVVLGKEGGRHRHLFVETQARLTPVVPHLLILGNSSDVRLLGFTSKAPQSLPLWRPCVT